MASQSTW
ncbi:hypothetical protein YPPY71_2031, partial [Yersinia pestis PY-71]